MNHGGTEARRRETQTRENCVNSRLLAFAFYFLLLLSTSASTPEFTQWSAVGEDGVLGLGRPPLSLHTGRSFRSASGGTQKADSIRAAGRLPIADLNGPPLCLLRASVSPWFRFLVPRRACWKEPE